MLSDGIQLLQAATIDNLLIENGAGLPASGNVIGELFYLTTGTKGLHIFTQETGWVIVGGSGTGQTLTAGTGISIVGTAVANTGVLSITAGTNIAIDNTTGVVTVSLNGVIPFNKGGTGLSNLATGYVKSTGVGYVSVQTISTADLLGSIPVTAGGTGRTAFTAGYLSYDGTSFNTSTTIAGSAISGNITGQSGGIAGIVAIANGGTGASTLLTGFIKSNGTALSSQTTISGSEISGSVAAATTATTATNVAGGTAGQLHYQSSPNTTAFLAGTVAGRVLTSAGAASVPTWSQPLYDVGMSYGNVAPAGDVMAFTANRAMILVSPLVNAAASAHVAAAASTVFSIFKKPAGNTRTQIGTMTFAAGATTATFVYTVSSSFAVGDMILFTLGTADTTLSTVAVTFTMMLN